MKQYRLLAALPLTLISLLISCCDVDDDPPCGKGSTTNYNLSVADKKATPYVIGDTLVFISNSQDTAICICTQNNNSYETIETRAGLHPECPSNYENYEVSTFMWSPKNVDLKFAVSLHEKILTSKYEQLNTINISFLNKPFYLSIAHLNRTSAVTYFGTKKFFNDSTYQNLSRILMDWDVPTDTVFYNTEYGLCGAAIDGKQWVLIRKY